MFEVTRRSREAPLGAKLVRAVAGARSKVIFFLMRSREATTKSRQVGTARACVMAESLVVAGELAVVG
jgi:hypothetical protein